MLVVLSAGRQVSVGKVGPRVMPVEVCLQYTLDGKCGAKWGEGGYTHALAGGKQLGF